MPSIAKTLREMLTTAIEARRALNGFVLNQFSVQGTYFPRIKLTEIPEHGKVWVVSLASDDLGMSRGKAFTREQPMQVALQKKIEGDPTEATDVIDQYEQLQDELRDACKNAVDADDRFTWLRTESLKDENGTAYNYMGLREANTFEAFFTAYYKTVLES